MIDVGEVTSNGRGRWIVRWTGADGKRKAFSRADRATVEAKRRELAGEPDPTQPAAALPDPGDLSSHTSWQSALIAAARAHRCALAAGDATMAREIAAYTRSLTELSKGWLAHHDGQELLDALNHLINHVEDIRRGRASAVEGDAALAAALEAAHRKPQALADPDAPVQPAPERSLARTLVGRGRQGQAN